MLSRAQRSGAQRGSGASLFLSAWSIPGAQPIQHLLLCFFLGVQTRICIFKHLKVPQVCLLSGKCIPEDESMWDNKCMHIMLGEKQLVHHLKCCLVRCTDMPRVRTHCLGGMGINPCSLFIMSRQQVMLSSSPSKCKKQVRIRASWCFPRCNSTKSLLSFL